MSNINELIKQKLLKYPSDVERLSKEALQAAERLPQSGVAEYLEEVVRKIVNERKLKHDP